MDRDGHSEGGHEHQSDGQRGYRPEMATKIAPRGEQGSLVEDRRQHDGQDQTRVERHLRQARNKSQQDPTQNEHDEIRHPHLAGRSAERHHTEEQHDQGFE